MKLNAYIDDPDFDYPFKDFEAELDSKEKIAFPTLALALEYQRNNSCFCVTYSFSDDVFYVVK